MRPCTRRLLHLIAAVSVAVLLAVDAAAATWDAEAAGCLTAFAKPPEANDKTLIQCADAFGASARLEKINATDRKTVETGLRWLYDNGSDLGARVARGGLLRLGVKVPAREPKGPEAAAERSADDRHRYDPPEARTADREASEKMTKDGVALLKKKKWREGTNVLERALAKDPRSETTLYNLACGEANLADRHADALGHLRCLADLGTEAATARLIKARTEPDFEPLRDDADFKRITGAVRVQVVNTIGAPGEPAVENLEKLLVKLDQRKPDTKDDDQKPLDHPQIHFKAHAKAQVALLAELMNHNKVELQPMPPDSTSKYDIIVRWGAKVTVGADGKKSAESVGPETVDDSVQQARRKQNKVLAQPEGAINKVNKVVDTPGRTYTEAENMGKRVGSTVDKAKGAAEKTKGLVDKINKL